MAFLDPILYFFGGSDETVGYARDYMYIILLGNTITHLYLGLNAVLRSSGHPQKAMYATIATVIINTILDPRIYLRFWLGHSRSSDRNDCGADYIVDVAALDIQQ